MPGTTLACFTDPHDLAAALQHGCHLELLVTTRGQFRARMTRIALSRSCLLATEEWLPRIAFLSLSAASVAIMLPVERQPSDTWGGVALRHGELITLAAGQCAHGRTDRPGRSGVICIRAQELIRHGRRLVGPAFAIPPDACRWRPAPCALRSLLRLYRAAIQVTQARPSAAADMAAAHGLEQQLIGALVECLSAGPMPPDGTGDPEASRIMSRLQDILRGRPGAPPSLAEICSALGIAARTLRSACHAHLGMGPGHYLRLHRMQPLSQIPRNAATVAGSRWWPDGTQGSGRRDRRLASGHRLAAI